MIIIAYGDTRSKLELVKLKKEELQLSIKLLELKQGKR